MITRNEAKALIQSLLRADRMAEIHWIADQQNANQYWGEFKNYLIHLKNEDEPSDRVVIWGARNKMTSQTITLTLYVKEDTEWTRIGEVAWSTGDADFAALNDLYYKVARSVLGVDKHIAKLLEKLGGANPEATSGE